MLTLTIDRASLSKPDLTFTSDPTSGLWIPEDGLRRPAIRHRRRYAGDSPWLDGSVVVSSAKEQASLPVTLYVQAGSTGGLETAQRDLEEALDQFVYDVTVTVDTGTPRVWQGEAADYDWGEVDSGLTRAFMARATVTIPVYPIPGSV